MKRLSGLLIGMMLVLGTCGVASAVTYTQTLDLNHVLNGVTDTYTYYHATPLDFSVPYDTVNSATLEIFASGISTEGNDTVTVAGKLVGTLTNQEWVWSLNPFPGYYDGTLFDLKANGIFATWTAGTPLSVTIASNEPSSWWDDHKICLVSSVFTLDYNNNCPPANVPEPTTMLLLGTGMIGLLGARKRFQKAA